MSEEEDKIGGEKDLKTDLVNNSGKSLTSPPIPTFIEPSP